MKINLLLIILLSSCSFMGLKNDDTDLKQEDFQINQDKYNKMLLEESKKGNLEEVKELLSKGADINYTNSNGDSALHFAVKNNDFKITKFLLENKIDVNKINKDINNTAFMIAAVNNHLEILKLLLNYNPDITILNGYGGTALIPACERGHVEVVELLLDKTKIDVNHLNKLHLTALLECVCLGNGSLKYQKIAKMLVEHGADINIKDRNNVSSLQHAENKGYTEIVKILNAR